MNDSSAPEARPKLDRRQVQRARQLLLSLVQSPRTQHVDLLEPDEAGALRFVSRQEAISRGLPVYTGRLSTLDKPYPVREAPDHLRGWCSVRFTANGNTAGQARLQKAFTDITTTKGAAAQ